MQFYYEGRRQLQPPVRLRTDLVARIRPCSDPAPPRHRCCTDQRRPDGRVDRCSELVRAGPTRTPTPFITWVTALKDEPSGRMRH